MNDPDPIKQAMEKKQGALAALMDISPDAAAYYLKTGPLAEVRLKLIKDWKDTEEACKLARQRNSDNRKISSTGNTLEGVSKDGSRAESMALPKLLYMELESRHPDQAWLSDRKIYKKEVWDKFPQFRKVKSFQ